MRVAVRERHQQRDGGAERRDLGERQIDEDDAALDHVHAEVGVDAREDQAGSERRREKREHRGIRHAPCFAAVFLMAFTSRLMS